MENKKSGTCMVKCLNMLSRSSSSYVAFWALATSHFQPLTKQHNTTCSRNNNETSCKAVTSPQPDWLVAIMFLEQHQHSDIRNT